VSALSLHIESTNSTLFGGRTHTHRHEGIAFKVHCIALFRTALQFTLTTTTTTKQKQKQRTHKNTHTVETNENSTASQLPGRTHCHRQRTLKRLPISLCQHDSIMSIALPLLCMRARG